MSRASQQPSTVTGPRLLQSFPAATLGYWLGIWVYHLMVTRLLLQFQVSHTDMTIYESKMRCVSSHYLYMSK